MRTTTCESVKINAPRDTVLRFASDPVLLADWDNKYIECGLTQAECHDDTISFTRCSRRGGEADWKLTVEGPDNKGITEVTACVTEETGRRYPVRWLQELAERRREDLIKRD